MANTFVALAGVLIGAVITGLFAVIVAHTNRVAQRTDNDRKEALIAVASLAKALADHRRAMWIRESQRLAGKSWDKERTISHETRSALTAPLTTVSILLPSISDMANEAAQITFRMRNAPDTQTLDALREAALKAVELLITTARTQFK